MLEIDNNKEFKILRLNKQEILKIGGYGICDSRGSTGFALQF